MQLLCSLLVVMLMTASTGPTQYKQDALAGVPIHRLTVDLSSPDIYVTAKVAIGHSEGFVAMCQRLHPIAAVNGGFFDTATRKPCGDIVVDGKILYDGCIGPALIIPKGGSPARIVSQSEYAKLDKTTLQLGLQTGPTLVKHGQVALNMKAEGFHIARYATRVALGLTSDRKLILIVTEVPVCFGKLAEIMVRAGCDSAVCLDGGSSSALYADGKVKAAPGRKLVSILIVLPHKETSTITGLTAASP